MPLFLITILQSFFIGVTEFLVYFIGKNAAKVVAGVSLTMILTGIFIAALYAILSGLSYVAPDSLIIAWGWFMPSNATGCLSAYGAMYLAKFIYQQNTQYQTSLFR